MPSIFHIQITANLLGIVYSKNSIFLHIIHLGYQFTANEFTLINKGILKRFAC